MKPRELAAIGVFLAFVGLCLVLFVELAGCGDNRTFPKPAFEMTMWHQEHCWTMFDPAVTGCVAVDEHQVKSYQVCVKPDGAAWWCSGYRREPAPPCFSCGARP